MFSDGGSTPPASTNGRTLTLTRFGVKISVRLFLCIARLGSALLLAKENEQKLTEQAGFSKGCGMKQRMKHAIRRGTAVCLLVLCLAALWPGKAAAAEDNALNAEIAETLLNDQGAQTTVVENGRKAVDLFQATPPGTFDAILMDIMMPEMDGIEATKAIRALDRPDAKTIPIIAMTANAFEEDAKKCLAAGMNAHLAKPLRIDLLAQTIVRYCRENA